MVRKLRPVAGFVQRVANGSGAERLPAQVRAIDVVNFRPSGASQTQRTVIKSILPRIKYANENIQINFMWSPQAVDNDKKQGRRAAREDRARLIPKAGEAKSDGAGEGEQAQAQQRGKSVLRLRFDGLPSADIPITGKQSAADIALLLSTTARRGAMPEEEREAYRPRAA